MPDKPNPAADKLDPRKMELRANPAPVTRLSKKAIVMGVGAGSLAISGAFAVALQPPTARGDAERRELYNTTTKPVTDQLASLPKSYSDMPQGGPRDILGEAMMGDVGRAIVLAEQRAQGSAQPVPGNAYAPRPQASQATMEARRSDLFFKAGGSANVQAPMDAADIASLLGQGKKSSTSQIIGGHRITAGTLIPASLITGINSDLPGPAIAQVTQNVYDSLTGDHLLIPQGAKLIGSYSNDINFGQSRAFIKWSRLINPDGTSIDLDELTASDLAGYSGLKDRVDNRTGALVRAGILSTVLGVGAELSQDNGDDEVAEAIRDAIQGTANTAGQKIIQRQLNVKPIINIRPGWSFQVIATQDLNLATYRH